MSGPLKPYSGRNASMTTRFFSKISSDQETPFWVHPKDWYDWMLNVNQVKFEVNFDDGFGGSATADNRVDLVTGPPEDELYDRDFRWQPTQGGRTYLDQYDELRTSLLSFTPWPMEAFPYTPTEYVADIKSTSGSYGEWGVSSWRDWPLFDDADFSFTNPYIRMGNIQTILSPKVMWRKVWENEDIEEELPNPGFRYQIPMACTAGVDMGSCGYPPTVTLNFNPTLGPIPYIATYDSVFEGANVVIGGPAYEDEIQNPLDNNGDPPNGWEEMDVEFKLVALSGREYTVYPRVQSGLESATAFTDPNPEWNEGQFPFAKNGNVNYGAYECSGYATATLLKV